VTRQYASAGAIVVTTDLQRSRVLLLEQTRANGERQTVAPKGRMEAGEAPLAAAIREVAEEAGLDDVGYAGYLGQQAYRFTDRDGTPAAKSVDWFLLTADDSATTARLEEGFTAARWIDPDDAATVASHAEFGPYLDRAADLIAWRQQAPLPFSTKLDRAVRDVATEASAILIDCVAAGIGVCGSAARGDFVDGWSDIDLIGWGLLAGSPLIDALTVLVDEASSRHDVRISMCLADPDGHALNRAGPLYDAKLRASLGRIGIEMPVIAGVTPAIDVQPIDVPSNLAALHQFARQRLNHPPKGAAEHRDRARRTLSVACSAARTVIIAHDPSMSLRLGTVVSVLDQLWPANEIGELLREYDAFRRAGAQSIDEAAKLAMRVPDAIAELARLVRSATATNASSTA
jgi:8-oxo-dGTP pyrophosphatase MutT (NUDIX family)